jgi:hypothetical protein
VPTGEKIFSYLISTGYGGYPELFAALCNVAPEALRQCCDVAQGETSRQIAFSPLLF